MRFEESGNPEYPFRLYFEISGSENEPGILGAVYRENNDLTAKMANPSSISSHDLWVASWSSEGDTERYFDTGNWHKTYEKLTEFHERTEEMIVRIAQESNVPGYRNYDLAIRRNLGEKALKLAELMAEKSPKLPRPEDLEPGSLEAGLRDLLSGESDETGFSKSS